MTEKEISERLQKLPGWRVENQKLIKEFSFSSYQHAVQFTNQLAALAEEMDHHPDILLTYRKVVVSLTTHSQGALSEKDFLFAEKVSSFE